MPGFSTPTKLLSLAGFVVPGAGHVFLGRAPRGIFLFFWFLFFVNAWLVAPVLSAWALSPDPKGMLAAAGVIWLYAVLDLLRILIWRNRKALDDAKRERFLGAFGLYLRGEYARARQKLKGVLRMDRDDPDAMFHIAMTYKREGIPRLAKRYFRRSLRVDPWRKWEDEVRRELADA
jgi:tetratricopeptide (TPR) repeat protein